MLSQGVFAYLRESKQLCSKLFKQTTWGTTERHYRNSTPLSMACRGQILRKETNLCRDFEPSRFNLRLFRLPQVYLQRWHSTTQRKCWKCGKDTDVEKEMFFCECGVIQKVDKLNYFQVLGVPVNFDVDLGELSQNYKNLQRQLHPDKHSLKPKEEQDLAELQSSYVINAYSTINRPLPRALYMLELHGSPLEEDNTNVDQEFLMQIMETNEEIIEAEAEEEVQRIEADNEKKMKECVQYISQAFKDNDIELAKAWTVKLKYFNNIDGKIREMKQISFDK